MKQAAKLDKKTRKYLQDSVDAVDKVSHAPPGRVFGFGGTTLSNLLADAATTSIAEQFSPSGKKGKRRGGGGGLPKPNLSNIRAETQSVQGDWIIAISASAGKEYFYNKKTRVATWTRPVDLRQK